MRIGAVPELRLQHLHKIEQYGLYKIIVYEGDSHEYYCFCTPEAAQAIDDYFAFRRRHGEKISKEETPEAPLIREEFDINDQLMTRYPKVTRPEGLGVLLNLKLQRSCIVPPLTPMKEGQKRGSKRNPIPRSHGFRKFVITAMVRSRINETIRNLLTDHLLTDHSVKLDKSYYYPTEEEMLQEYFKVVDDMTINEENRLRRENEMLKVTKSEYQMLKEQVEQNKVELEELKQRYPCIHRKLNELYRPSPTDLQRQRPVKCCDCGIVYNDNDQDWYVIDEKLNIIRCARCYLTASVKERKAKAKYEFWKFGESDGL